MTIDTHEVPGVYFGTSTGQLFASADEGESWQRDRELPAGDRVGRGRDRRLSVAEVYLPSTLRPLFAGLPRHLELDAATVDEALDLLEERWPGLRDRLCEPGPASPLRFSAGTSTSTSTGSERRSRPRSRPAPGST